MVAVFAIASPFQEVDDRLCVRTRMIIRDNCGIASVASAPLLLLMSGGLLLLRVRMFM